MKTFEIVLQGWDYRTSDTDDLIKWVNAPDIELAKQYAVNKGWEVRTINLLPFYAKSSDGVDAIIGSNGLALELEGKCKMR